MIIFFLQTTKGDQELLYCKLPSKCRSINCFVELPPEVSRCYSAVHIFSFQIEEFFGYPTRLPLDFNSLNQFCKQYTRDNSAWPSLLTINNYYNYCPSTKEEYLTSWDGHQWVKSPIETATYNVQALTCVFQCIDSSLFVDLKVNDSDGPVEIMAGERIFLSWRTRNAFFCEALGDWSGSKDFEGFQEIELPLAKEYSFSLKCKDALNNEIQDTVNVSVKARRPLVITKPVIETR